ncbi:hypothetical protein ORV05_12520 [Amycolatopsis cynarae]|uniref:Uncharacterized protein n=1 Tax=Amycolatopsis cynarae TaxID=2995223 RepID=A0ABY7B9C5_9PSEU|nr:hypothetical protein [Amycolatopsis sp. HUAS 11-8]WAL68555.1 hypothetical protein ORV05_12520 [Amycolatopsis sp. HUAS 11-8]
MSGVDQSRRELGGQFALRLRVKIQRQDEGYVLGLTPSQFELIRRVVITTVGPPRSSEMIGLLAGPAARDVLRTVSRMDIQSSSSGVELHLTPNELHGLRSILTSAYLDADSEETFYVRTGFFTENVKGVARAMSNAIGEL